jgi:hypothetical protein
MMVLTRAELDEERCEGCGEIHEGGIITMSARCHPEAGILVAYERGCGVLHFHCAKCEQPIALISVAETWSMPGVRH